ncbi:MAG: hypothetical protein IJS80_02185, partial [Lachnospiraceae bacterium]|nr:hypothetical protein [Lachnospiraceae bacterium]
MPPKVNSFASSYEAQSDAADIDSKVDDSLKSFMAQGDAAFENEDVDGNGLSRQDVISGVRENILKRLDEENKGSRKEADRMKDDHDAYSGDIVGDISSMQRTVRTIAETRDNLAALEEREENDTSNAVFKFFKFRGIRKRNARKKIESLNSKKREQIRKIREKAGKWSAVRSDYAKNKVRKRYKTYDALAKSWYELTHERAVSALPEDATDEAKRAAMENRAIPEAYEKNIIEYTGVYQMSALDTMLQVAEETPDFALNIQNIPKAPYKDSRNAGTGDDYLTKSHKKILMLSEADENTGIKTRFKFDASFLGNRAKSQFVAADTEETALLEGDALPQGDADNRMYAEDAGLESDRKDINGRFLFSEKNAEILHARLKRNGRTVYGFYQNGEFLTNDEEGETLDNGETRVSGKKDMKFFGRRNWNKQEDAEKLRVAIRTSPFFQHVNSRTIQYYAGYEAASDYVDTIEEVMEKKWEDSDVGRDDAVSALREAPDRLDNIPDSVKGPALAEYLKESVTEEGQPAFPLADPATDPVLGYAINNHKKILQTACLILLASDDGRLWVLAKNIIIKVPKIANRRTRIKMKYIPSEGMLMRMALLDEMVKYKGNSDFSEDEDDEEFDLMESAGATFTGKQVLQEELDSKRGAGNWIKRNLLNGKIIKTALSATSTGFDFADNLGDTIDYAKNDGYKDETSDERE